MVTIDDIQIFIMTHNRANLLGDSIRSIFNQTAGVKSITVLDNESTDDTEKIVHSFSSKKINYIKTYGFLGNFYKAKEIADKKYLMLFHDDDILHPEYLEKVLIVLNTEKNLSAVYSRYREFFNNDIPNFFLPLKNTITKGGGYYLFENKKDFAIFMFFNERIAYATAVYKTDIFKKIDLEYDKYSKFNDWPFMVNFGDFGNIALIADFNAFFIRRHIGQDTWTHTNIPSIEQILNWDLFFFNIFFDTEDEILRNIYSRKSTYFYLGKYNAFLPTELKKNYSEKEIRKIARYKGLFDYDENLISTDVYERLLYSFSKKRLKNLLQMENGENKMLKDKLEIFIITYNRKEYLKHTLESVYSEKSPIRDLQITILDNKSTDGSSELIDNIIADFPNTKHIIHNRNIGGNANIARCYELAKKDYFWILCDDDEIVWKQESWGEVEAAMETGADAIVVSNYINPKENIPQLLGQLSFVPAGIYKTANLTDTVMQNISFQISCCFPQLALVCKLINDNKRILILDKWIVKMVEHPNVSSYSRGMDTDKHPLMANMTWSLGILKTIQMIKDEKIREEIIETYRNEKGTFMLHPNVFIEENRKLGSDSFINLSEYYSLLPSKMKYLFSYDLYRNRDEFKKREEKYEADLVRASFNYRVGAFILFLPKLFFSLFKRKK